MVVTNWKIKDSTIFRYETYSKQNLLIAFNSTHFPKTVGVYTFYIIIQIINISYGRLFAGEFTFKRWLGQHLYGLACILGQMLSDSLCKGFNSFWNPMSCTIHFQEMLCKLIFNSYLFNYRLWMLSYAYTFHLSIRNNKYHIIINRKIYTIKSNKC